MLRSLNSVSRTVSGRSSFLRSFSSTPVTNQDYDVVIVGEFCFCSVQFSSVQFSAEI
jgi:hypothetical protein